MLDAIIQRQSVRSFDGSRPVAQETVVQLLEAGFAAPSANNSRPWEVLVVTDAALRDQLAETHNWSYFVKDAPVVFVVCGDPRKSPEHWVEDCSAMVENLLIAAQALGLGACWVAACGDPERKRQAHVRTALGIPDEIYPVALIPVGYPREQLKRRTPRVLTQALHYERFGEATPPR
jgi:nitroreductase